MEKYNKHLRVSVVIPIYNEVESIPKYYPGIVEVLEGIGEYELIYIDDGSSDGSTGKLKELSLANPRVRHIRLYKNYGQQNALYAGLKYAAGSAIILMDGDGQFDPSSIKALLDEHEADGFELVSGVREWRKDSILGKALSIAGNYFINKAFDIRQKDFGAVKLLGSDLVRRMMSSNNYQMVHPYSLAYSMTKSFSEAPIIHHAREYGKSKWNFLKRLGAYFDIVLIFHPHPFMWLLVVSLAIAAMSLLLAGGIFLFRLFNPDVYFSGLIIFFDAFLFITAFIFFVLSIMGDFVLRIYRSNFTLAPEDTVEEKD